MPASQSLSIQGPLKRGPQNDHIFVDHVDASYTEQGIKDHVHERTHIDIGVITVLKLYERDGNKAFKVSVPAGKQRQTIVSFGTDILAEPYRFFNSKVSAAGQTRSPIQNNRNGNYNNQNNFRGSAPISRPQHSGNHSGRPNHNGGNNHDRGRSSRPRNYNQQWGYQQQSYQQQRPRGNYY